MNRRTIFVANWKMHKTIGETQAFIDAFLPHVPSFPQRIEFVVAPPFTSLAAAQQRLRSQARVLLGAQNMHWKAHGAYTGEISAPMLLEFGVRYVILGHSERRVSCNETDASVHLKVKAAIEHGVSPIVAVGETHEQRMAKATDDHVRSQTRAALEGLSANDLAQVIIAYEPIWAIGTGDNCDPIEANRVMSVIRDCVDGLNQVPMLYGGSMKPENVAQYMAQPQIDGGLVGGASLNVSTFVDLVRNAVSS
jgi:triosephosphate isomerase